MNLYQKGSSIPKYWSKKKNKPIHFSNLPRNMQKHIRKLMKNYPQYDWMWLYKPLGVQGLYWLEEGLKNKEV